MIVKAFITHKKAEKYADCQDRFSVNIDTKSIAVSDGMGSTWQQKRWASLLVRKFTEDTSWSPMNKEDIKPLAEEWRRSVSEYIENLKKDDTAQKSNIIFRNERNLAEGKSAGATFLGIRFTNNAWSGIVLGDSCLIEWNGTEAKFHTSQDVEEFDNYPDYFDSNTTKEGKGTPKSINGFLEKDHILLMVSDPFSDFLFEKSKNTDGIKEYIHKLRNIESHEEFLSLVDDWRKEGMHNDDTTLIVIEASEGHELEIKHADDIVKLVAQESDPSLVLLKNSNTNYYAPKAEIAKEKLAKEIVDGFWGDTYRATPNFFKAIFEFFKRCKDKEKEQGTREKLIKQITATLSNYSIYKK